MSDMMNRFRGLILFFMAAATVAGFAGPVPAAQTDAIFIFNREYYSVKDLTVEDVWKLKEINASDNIGAAKAAGLILGRYYAKHDDLNKGYQMIKSNLDDSYLDTYMRANGHLWAYDAATKSGDTARADAERAYLKKMTYNDKTEKAFKIYCDQENISYSGSPMSCIDPKPVVKEKFDLPEVKAAPAAVPVAAAVKEEPVKPAPAVAKPAQVQPQVTAPDDDMLKPSKLAENKVEEQPAADTAAPDNTVIDLDNLQKDMPSPIKTENTGRKVAVVDIVNSVKNPDIAEAMLYSISKLKLNMDMDFEGGKPVYDYLLDAGEKTVTQGSSTVDFSFDRKAEMRTAARIAIQSGAKAIAIGYAEGLRDNAEEIADEFSGKVKFYIFNMQDRDFQNKLKEIKSRAGGSIVSYVLAGNQEQTLKVVPFLKYYSPRPDKTVIVAAINDLTKKFYTGDYADYTYNAIVVTDVMPAGNADAEKYYEDFIKDFGKGPTASDLIGYDMLVYMEKKRNPAFTADYLTGITKIENGQVYRKTGAYRIIGGGKLRRMDY